MASRSPRSGAPAARAKDGKQIKKPFSTIYENPMLDHAKIQKIPENCVAAQPQTEHAHAPLDKPYSIPVLPSKEWLSPTAAARELEEKELVEVLKKGPSRQLAPDPDFRRMRAEDIVRYLQKEQRLSFVPSSKSITSRKSSLEFKVENQKDNFILFRPAGNPFHSKPKSKTLARKIEVPWRGLSNFTSPTAQRKKIFQDFHKTSPDPPKSPPPEANTSKPLIERSHWNHLPTRSHSIEGRKLLSSTEKANPGHGSQLQKQTKAKAREIRRYITESQPIVISEGREMAALSKSTNGLAAIGRGKKLKPKKTKVSEYDQPSGMEGTHRHGRQTKGKDSANKHHRNGKSEHAHQGSGRSRGLDNMYIGHYGGPDSSHQFQR